MLLYLHLLSMGKSSSLLPIYAVPSRAKPRTWLYHFTGPFSCNCFLTSSASLYALLLKHPFRMGQGSHCQAAPPLPCWSRELPPSLPFQTKCPMIALRVWVASSPPACIFESTCCPPLTSVKAFPPCISDVPGSSSAMQLLYLSASFIAKNGVFSLFLASLAVVLFYFQVFPNYSLMTIFMLHPRIVNQSTGWERIPPCDKPATSSAMESSLSLFIERGFSKFSKQVESHPPIPKRRIQI